MANAITQVIISANAKTNPLPPSVQLNQVSLACNEGCLEKNSSLHFQRRIFAWGLAGAVLGLNVGDENVWAAARKAPAAPTGEKKDPNVSGVLAKVIASRKRKEAMKEAMAKQRDKGKAIDK